MGMMNVLMQLRKCCNHPDLFEPRSVVTPFVLPSLSCTVPSFICSATSASSLMDRVSLNLVQPMWCGSGGLPSIDGALQHDSVETKSLQQLSTTMSVPTASSPETTEMGGCPDELKELVAQVHKLRRDRTKSNISFRNSINQKRCHAPCFPYPDSLLTSLEVEYSVFQRSEPVEVKNRNILLTPELLLKMRKDEQARSEDMEEIIEKFVFCVPSAGARTPVLEAGTRSIEASIATKKLDEMLLEPFEELVRPYRKAQARLSSFFPDKKLIQFDAGKLQSLAVLLRNLKRGSHRCLIFTQMSKMLDLLEAFLNLNGHTYLRLDGSTGVDRRQRYMDRFNNDTKIFCFILSTRSGGMGINLTGADTVIFYDSDWNPAMDAQAQDRAHRIGQTRDVHIYRLITEHTIEENILLKAKQKKNLDIMVMDQGKFDASHQSKGAAEEESPGGDQMKDVYTKGGLRAILGVEDGATEVNTESGNGEDEGNEASGMSNEQMESAMAALEDEDDVQALRGAQKEAAEEMQEFDENAEIKKDSDAEDEDEEADGKASRPKKKQKKAAEETKAEEPTDSKNEESELEKEFAAWQTTVGFDEAAIESSLSPMERYALSFRENIDPFYSVFYINELRRKAEAAEPKDEIDIEEIEREKATEERRAMDDGDLLGTRPRPDRLIRQRNLYRREKARLRSDKKRRKITGENWVQKVDGQSKHPFWYNEDTGEAIWDTPSVIIELQAEAVASQNGWGSLQIKILTNIMGFLTPYPERQCCSLVCKQWKSAANDFRFVRHVYPVEMGALGRDPSRRDHNHFGSIEEALSTSLPGDTIELSDGHYWVRDPGLIFDKPIKLVGDEHNAANVVIEMSGSVHWTGQGGFIEGVTFRRPKMTSAELPNFPMLKIEGQGRVTIVHSVLDNDGSTGSVVVASGAGRKGNLTSVSLRNGGSHSIELSGEEGISLNLSKCTVRRVKVESRVVRGFMV
jgi:superfamily II DNA/RNA helicase